MLTVEIERLRRDKRYGIVPYTKKTVQRWESRTWILPLDQLRGLTPLWRGCDVNEAGVYFLWLGPMLVYVGQSKTVGLRVGQHANFQKRFTHSTYLKAHPLWIREIESQYVLHYSPPLNLTRLG